MAVRGRPVRQSIAGKARVDEIRDLSRRRVEIFSTAGSDWRFAASLKSISEDTAQEYEGRALLELIQNGHDALASGRAGRIHVLLDDSGHAPVLYVANDGAPFGPTNFLAVVGFGLSDKGPGEGIGNKGLGFRSVLQLTDHPEVYSKDPDNPADQVFSGYSFRFPTEAELFGLTEDATLAERLVSEVSPFDLPLPADVEDHLLLRFGVEGFATVVRLPLRDDRAVEDVRRQVADLASADAPILLFLERLVSLELTIRSSDDETETVILTRSESPATLVSEHQQIREVDLGEQGRYLLTRRPTSSSDLREALAKSAAARLIDKRWLDWQGEAWVGVALRLDEALRSGTIYTFLPMETPAPLAAHVHAPFFTKLARRDVNMEVPLNAFLMGEIAASCLDLMQTLRKDGEHGAVVSQVVDLVAWKPPQHGFLARACIASGTTLATEAILPIAGKAEWSSLEEAFAWPHESTALSVVSAEAIAALGYPILDPEIGSERQARLAALRLAVLRSPMEPSGDMLAQWVESMATVLKADDPNPERWARFYDDLSVLFDRASAPALRGRRIILDQDLNLRPAMGAESEGRRTPVMFFAPSVEEEGAEAVDATRLPRELETRIVYTHSAIPWTIAEPTLRRRPGRQFLESNGLVREYRTDRLLELLHDVMRGRPSRRVQVAALQYGCALYPGLNEAQRATLAEISFAAPTGQGQWLPARSLAFSRSRGTVGGALLDRLVGAATAETPELSALAVRIIAGPVEWPVKVEDQSRWESFLRAIGVHDGIPLTRAALEGGDGNRLQPDDLGNELGLDTRVQELWEAEVRCVWDGGAHPYTRYRFASVMVLLPGAGESELLGPETREVYAQLISLGLATWPDNVFEVVVWRPERRVDQQDVHRWPTPLSSYLHHGRWVPIEAADDEDDRAFVRPENAWISVSGQLPRFVPTVAPAVRSRIRNGLVERLKQLGIGIWEDPAYGGAVLQALPELLTEGSVALHDVASFKKQCRQAWEHLLQEPSLWPWPEEVVATLVVTEGGQLRSLSAGQDFTVVVPDETDQTKQTLIGLTARPVLVADPAQGQALVELLRQHSIDALPTSDVTVEVYGDDQLVVADRELPAFITDDRQWIATVTALVAELKSGPFTRHTEQSIRQILDRLRIVKIVHADEVRLVVGGEDVIPPAQTTSLPIEDGVAPTIVLWPTHLTVFEELERCAGSVAYLVGQPQLAESLQLAFTRLGQAVPSPPEGFTDEMLAHALQVSEELVRESRAHLRGPLVGLLDCVRVLVCYCGGPQELAVFDLNARDVSSEAEVVSILEAMPGLLPLAPSQLAHECRIHGGLADLRDALGLDFVLFNEALARLEPPHDPLHHPERHEQAMTRFIESHEEVILSRLREAYLPGAREGTDLTTYGEARCHEGLVADPDWLDRFAEPPEALLGKRVGEWLAGHGADPDLDRPSELPEIKDLRARNFDRLDGIVRIADPRLRAWCRKHGHDVPAGWSAPLSEARSALEASYLADFWYLSAEELLDVVAGGLGWPDAMPLVLDLDRLGLDPSELLTRDEADADDRRRRQYERTHLQIDGLEVSVDVESLGRLADAVTSGLTEELLSQSGKVALAELPGHSATRRGMPGGRGLTVTRHPGMSDDQRTGVGLVGEVVARAWLGDC